MTPNAPPPDAGSFDGEFPLLLLGFGAFVTVVIPLALLVGLAFYCNARRHRHDALLGGPMSPTLATSIVGN